MDKELYFALSGLFIAITSIALGLFVFLKNKKAKVNQSFALFCVSVFVWSGFYILWPLAESKEGTLFWFRMLHVGSIFISITYFHFIVTWLGLYQKKKKAVFIGYCLAFFFLLFVFSPLFIKDMVPKFSMRYWAEPGILYHFYLLMFFGFAIYSFYLLLVNYNKATGIKKKQIGFILAGIVIAYIGGSTNYLLWYDINVPPYGNILGAAFVISSAYAIVKYRLMNIKVILTELLVVLIAFVLLVETFLSTSLYEVLFRATIFLIFCFFAYLLVKSVLNEVKRRIELERLTWELKAAYGKLEKLDKAKSDFISIASHQLRTPLTAIKAYVSMILEGTYGKMDRRIKDKMHRVFQASDRLKNLVNDLLNVSRIEAGKIEIELEKTNLEDIISDLVKELKVKAENKAIYLKFKKRKRKLPDILVDKKKIKEVIINLIDNAIKYTQKGGVTVKVQTHDSRVRVIVSDTGIGIVPGEADSLFDSFTRGQTGVLLNTEGLGLGLYIAKRFIELQNGKIWAKSKGKGKGSTFYIELPVK